MPEPKKRAVKRTDAQRAAENKYKKAKQKKIQCNFFCPITICTNSRGIGRKACRHT